ncbi:hypothetical protein T10_3866 [Trichinella papuae]|uniref:Uncharacterized protein n=1 Tax=Trichinella papuae TaxID=268474 RepID=A0A0V1MVX9_9BILA|nr:hypothetical protein T10_3866 [Trichinella papuae]
MEILFKTSCLRKSFPIIETIQLNLVGKSGFGEVEPSTSSVSLGVKTDAKFSGARWSKWQVDTPLFDRLSAGHSGRRYQLHGKGNVTFVAVHFGCDWQLFSIGCGAHNQLYCTYNGSVMSSFVHRLLSLPGSVELLCTQASAEFQP